MLSTAFQSGAVIRAPQRVRPIVLVICAALLAGCGGEQHSAAHTASRIPPHSASQPPVADVGEMAAVDANVWSAIFMTNNQVYVAHVLSITPDSVVLANVYTLPKVPSPNPASRPSTVVAACSASRKTVAVSDILYREVLSPGSRIGQYLDQGPGCGVPWGTLSPTARASSPPSGIPPWSAVFLSDNEVFFGRIRSDTAEGIDLVNVFYIRTTGSGPTTPLTVVGLVGTQFQCPTDELAATAASIRYVETLQPGSFIVNRITGLQAHPQPCP